MRYRAKIRSAEAIKSVRLMAESRGMNVGARLARFDNVNEGRVNENGVDERPVVVLSASLEPEGMPMSALVGVIARDDASACFSGSVVDGPR